MSSHTQAVMAVKWGGDGLIYSAARDCAINVWAAADGKLVRRRVLWLLGAFSGRWEGCVFWSIFRAVFGGVRALPAWEEGRK